MITNQERNEVYKKATVMQQYLYHSPEAGVDMYAIFQTYNLPEERYSQYAHIVGDVILGFYQQSDLPKLLSEEFDLKDSALVKITNDLNTFLEPLHKNDGEAEIVDQPHAEQKFMSPKEKVANESSVDAPEETSSIPLRKIRTMEDDAKELTRAKPPEEPPTYSSSQSDLFTPRSIKDDGEKE